MPEATMGKLRTDRQLENETGVGEIWVEKMSFAGNLFCLYPTRASRGRSEKHALGRAPKYREKWGNEAATESRDLQQHEQRETKKESGPAHLEWDQAGELREIEDRERDLTWHCTWPKVTTGKLKAEKNQRRPHSLGNQQKQFRSCNTK
jgi:hypothetical protein